MPQAAALPWHAEFRLNRRVEKRLVVLKHRSRNLWLVANPAGSVVHGPLSSDSQAQACIEGRCACASEVRPQKAARRALAAEQEAIWASTAHVRTPLLAA